MRRQDDKTDMWTLEYRNNYQGSVPETTRRGGGDVRFLPSSTAILAAPAMEQLDVQSIVPPPSRSSTQTKVLADLMEATKKQVTLDLLFKDHLERFVQSTPAPPAPAPVAAALTPRLVESRSYRHGYMSSPDLPSQLLPPRASLQLHSPPHASRPTTTMIQDDLLLKALQERTMTSAATIMRLQNCQDHPRQQHQQRQELGLQLLLQQQTLSTAYLPPSPSLSKPAATHVDLVRMIHEQRDAEVVAADALSLQKVSRPLLVGGVGGSDRYRFQQEVMLQLNHATTTATASPRSSSPRVAAASSSSSRNDHEKETTRDEPATPRDSKMMKIGLLEDDETGVGALHRSKLSFPEKIYFMLEEVERQGRMDIVSFVSEGTAFMIHKSRQFEDDIMPLFFASRRTSSFQRQLNIYGFIRISQEPWKGAYKHVLFARGKKTSLSKIKRCIDAKK